MIANFALIFTCIFNGISQGAQPLVSRYYGEGNERAVKKILHLGLATGVVFSLFDYFACLGIYRPDGSLV